MARIEGNGMFRCSNECFMPDELNRLEPRTSLTLVVKCAIPKTDDSFHYH